MRTIKVGSRDSDLAIAQTKLIVDAVQRLHPGVVVELVTMKTIGDKILDRSLDKIGGKGLFVKELDDALLEGKVDICVHSYKDLPVPANPRLPVVAVSAREDPRDVLVLPEGVDTFRPGSPIGTSSLRRRLQLQELFPGVRCEPVRGNIPTRLRKLDSGEFGALALAAAGMKRLNWWERVYRVFAVDEIIPAPCQGMLAVQGRAGEDYSYLSGIGCVDSTDASIAERSFIEELGVGCTSPVAAFAGIDGEEVHLSALYVDEGGVWRKGAKKGGRASAAELGRALACELKGAAND